ncbi:hypothetical protein B296_00042865 [Ensete ventricosum]|uniref:Uncharacterized protein n=1 Tax=Ensete ventricosum TaxID=4639 RepID=A0A426X4M8_ENSVE|nr:hypothetical protein B296_00042865 [Ensete ventricosum]
MKWDLAVSSLGESPKGSGSLLGPKEDHRTHCKNAGGSWIKRDERSEEGWPATARPPVGVVGHGQVACRSNHPRLGPYKGRRLRPGPLQGWSAVARALVGVAGYGQEPCKGDRIGRPWAWLAPVGAAPAGVGSTCRGDAHKGAPFEDGVSLQGRRLRAQHPQELPPKGQRCLPQRGSPMGKVAASGTQHSRLHSGDRWEG